ncbi:response regulator transcription factor [Parasedimentitalea huanghaiensis]|uniref:HTH luxR-type domain-containing protein n=1 Tax=Parasedimentitalea huanghaiensis TaxID=2682100 RepID=A0A6L6WHP7_9RHOB|nr:LuxR C-terminal-related transcriptional regulator [Zongyanglinia huanghaiensis]MVO17336.1 hypothetical protein [Zongyanglinia huanghaiensis]
MTLEHKFEWPAPEIVMPMSLAAELTRSIGTTAFVQTTMRFAYETAGADFVSVFCLGDRDKPLLMGTACRLGQNRADRAAKGYVRHVEQDRNAQLLQGARGVGDFLTVQEADNIPLFTYRRDCYDLPGISGRVSLVRRTPAYGLSVSLYSSSEKGPFPKHLYSDVKAVLGYLLATTERHVAFSMKGPVWQGQDIQTRLALTYPDLTAREREVAAMAIKGRTAAETADLLNLAETTIITHRKNAYRRMNVASLRQLVATL